MATAWCVLTFLCVSECYGFLLQSAQQLPLILTTWPYEDAVRAGWSTIHTVNMTAVDAVEATGHTCEMLQCRYAVGFGGSPDEQGETTLDAMLMDGLTHNVGGVGDLRRVKQAISVARRVLDNTDHSLIVGDHATKFAVENGFTEESLQTNFSKALWENWKAGNCQPNFRENVTPNPRTSCGPYHPINSRVSRKRDVKQFSIGPDNHDTIGIIAINRDGHVATGTSTNGLTNKIPGRVGDSPIAGAGAYADNDIGAAMCTGNGDIMMRFLPSYHAVMRMAGGATPTDAAADAIARIRAKYPDFGGAVVAANKDGQYGAACHKWTNFAITLRNPNFADATVLNITCH